MATSQKLKTGDDAQRQQAEDPFKRLEAMLKDMKGSPPADMLKSAKGLLDEVPAQSKTLRKIMLSMVADLQRCVDRGSKREMADKLLLQAQATINLAVKRGYLAREGNAFWTSVDADPMSVKIQKWINNQKQLAIAELDSLRGNARYNQIKKDALAIYDLAQSLLLRANDPTSAYYQNSTLPYPEFVAQVQGQVALFISNYATDSNCNELTKCLENFGTTLRSEGTTIYSTQRALDGLTMAIKQRLFGELPPASLSLKDYFPTGEQGLANPNISDAEFKRLVGKLFDSLSKTGSKDLDAMRISLEANFGENCAILDKLLLGMDMPQDAIDGLKPAEKAKEFFIRASASKKHGRLWGDLSRQYQAGANRILTETISISPQGTPPQLAVVRDKFDLAGTLSLLDAYDSETFMKELGNATIGSNYNQNAAALDKQIALKDRDITYNNAGLANVEKQLQADPNDAGLLAQKADYVAKGQKLASDRQSLVQNKNSLSQVDFDRFLVAVAGVGDQFSQPATATLLQGHEALQAIYGQTSANFDTFIDLSTKIAINTSLIYRQPFGSKFQVEGADGIKREGNRVSAAFSYMGKLKDIPSPQLLDAMVSKYINPSYYSDNANNLAHRISWNRQQELIATGFVSPDIMNTSRMKSYRSQIPYYKDLAGRYEKDRREASGANIAGISISNPGQRMGRNVAGFYLPDTYLAFINEQFNSLFKQIQPYDPNKFTLNEGFEQRRFGSPYSITNQLDVSSQGLANSSLNGLWYGNRTESSEGQATAATRINTQGYNLGAFGMGIYEMAANYINANSSLLSDATQSSESTYYDAKLRTITPADLLIIVNGQEIKTGGKTDFRDLNALVLARTSKGWTRVALNKIYDANGLSLQDKLNKEVERYFASNRRAWTENVSTEIGVEHIDNGGKPALDNGKFGFLVGAEHAKQDTRLAGLFAKTASDNRGGVLAYGYDPPKADKESGVSRKIVTVAALDLSNVETDIRGNNNSSGRGGIFGNSGYGAGTGDGKSIVASYQAVDKLYSMLTLGNRNYGLTVQAKTGKNSYAGGDVLYNYGPNGMESVRGDGSYVHSDYAMNIAGEYVKEGDKLYASTVHRIKVAEGKYLTLTGAALPPLSQSDIVDMQALFDTASSLSARMKAMLESVAYAKMNTYQQRQVEWEFSQQITGLLESSKLFSASQFVRDKHTELSIALESKEFTGKVGLSSFGKSNDRFVATMVDISNSFSITAGFNSEFKSAYGASSPKSSQIKNFAGLRYQPNSNLSFMVATTNLFDMGGRNASTSLSVVHNWDDGWFADANIDLKSDKNGHYNAYDASVFVGNQKIGLTVGKNKSGGFNSEEAAVEAYLKNAHLFWTADWILGMNYQHKWANDAPITGNRLELYVRAPISPISRNLSFDMSAFYENARTNRSVADWIGFRVGARYDL